MPAGRAESNARISIRVGLSREQSSVELDARLVAPEEPERQARAAGSRATPIGRAHDERFLLAHGLGERAHTGRDGDLSAAGWHRDPRRTDPADRVVSGNDPPARRQESRSRATGDDPIRVARAQARVALVHEEQQEILDRSRGGHGAAEAERMGRTQLPGDVDGAQKHARIGIVDRRSRARPLLEAPAEVHRLGTIEANAVRPVDPQDHSVRVADDDELGRRGGNRPKTLADDPGRVRERIRTLPGVRDRAGTRRGGPRQEVLQCLA